MLLEWYVFQDTYEIKIGILSSCIHRKGFALISEENFRNCFFFYVTPRGLPHTKFLLNWLRYKEKNNIQIFIYRFYFNRECIFSVSLTLQNLS